MLAGLFALLSNILFFTGYISNKNSFEKPLNKEDEKKLLIKIANGDKNAKNELAKHNLRLVVHIVKKYASYQDTDELISVGNVGLAKAINTYSLEKSTQFATYAARCIENEILMTIRSNKKNRENKSIYEPITTDKDGNEVTLLDLLCEDEEMVEKEVEKDEIKELLMHIVKNNLTEREYEIICYRYGLENHDALTQKQIAKMFDISRSYVSRIETKALNKLRDYITNNDINF